MHDEAQYHDPESEQQSFHADILAARVRAMPVGSDESTTNPSTACVSNG